MKKKRFAGRYAKGLAGLLGLGLLLFLADLIFPFRVQPRYSTLVEAADGSVLHAFLNADDKWRLYTELDEISPTLHKTLIFKEDKWFYYHPGVNPAALFRALFNNVATGRRTSGASTITMQVVRLLEPRPRTYLNKLKEIFRAFQLEVHYSKEEILQLYVNLVPYGSNIEGIKSASLLYLGKPPELLSLAEVTALTIIPNRPTSLRPDGVNKLLIAERNRWLRRFDGLFDRQTIEDALNEPLTARRREAPKAAPHLAIRLRQEHPGVPILKTTLQRGRQTAIEQLTRNYAGRLRFQNIRNAAVFVLNNQTMTVEAYVGSADFTDSTDGGQVDGIRAVRSPGSTLKPLLFATAFEKGLLTPKSVLNDVPTNFSGFEPENFDRLFHGKVTVEFALANSLNVPAVQVLHKMGTASLVEKLKKAEFQTVRKQSGRLGLSLVLGGCGVTLEELTTLFAAFGNEGRFEKPQFLRDQRSGAVSELVSPEATYLVTQILTQITRPDLPNNYAYTYHLPKIAWKTGTSFGKKDAWSIGYNGRYTVGIWIGNFSGEGVPELNGANIATPLLFDVFNTIDYNAPANWYREPDGLSKRQVCAESGQVPSEFCTHLIEDDQLTGISSTLPCQHRKRVWLDVKKRFSYCTYCLPADGRAQEAWVPNDPPELISWFESRHIAYEKVPPHNPSCTRVFGNTRSLLISYPVDGATYRLNRKEQNRLSLTCQTGNDVSKVYWYLNDKLLQASAPAQPVFCQPPAGKVKISCADDKGRHTDSFVTIVYE